MGSHGMGVAFEFIEVSRREKEFAGFSIHVNVADNPYRSMRGVCERDRYTPVQTRLGLDKRGLFAAHKIADFIEYEAADFALCVLSGNLHFRRKDLHFHKLMFSEIESFQWVQSSIFISCIDGCYG